MSAIAEQFAALQRDDPERPLIILPEEQTTVTASDLWCLHLDIVRKLEALQIRDGALMVCAIGNRPELPAALLACRQLGVALLAIDSAVTSAELAALCERFGASALMTCRAITPGERNSALITAPVSLVRYEAVAANYPGTALLKLTSGTTGTAKAVRTTEAALVADGMQIIASMGILPAETQLTAIPLAHSYALGVVVMPLLLQGTPMVLRESFIPQQLSADARRFGVRRFPGVPFMFEYLVEHPPASGWPEELTRLISAGARLSPEVTRAFYDRFHVKVHSFYGTTETAGIAYDADDDPDATTVGRPLPGVSITLRSEAGLPPGVGRVHVRSDAVSDGYLGADNGDFIDGGFLTGDYGRIGADGRLVLDGRVSSFINVAGRKVPPEDVEAVLRKMPQLADARVTGAFDALRGEQVVAVLVKRAGMAVPSDAEIRRFCSKHLAPYKIPRLIVFVDAIPVNARGKTDRGALQSLVRCRTEQPR